MEAAEAERVAAEMAEDSMPDAPPVPSIMVAQVRPSRAPRGGNPTQAVACV